MDSEENKKVNTPHTKILEFFGLDPSEYEKRVYKSGSWHECECDDDDNTKGNVNDEVNDNGNEDTEGNDYEERIEGAFVVYRDENGYIRYSEQNFIDDEHKQEFSKYLGEVMQLGQKPVVSSEQANEHRENLNKLLAGALSQASYGNYQSCEKYIEKAEEYYNIMISEYIRKHYGFKGVSCGSIALFALLLLFIEHSYDLGFKFTESTEFWGVGIIASILGALVSIFHKSEMRIVQDVINAQTRDFNQEIAIRILFGVIMAIVLIAAVKSDWISSRLFDEHKITTYTLIGFISGYMESRITSMTNKLLKLIGLFDDNKEGGGQKSKDKKISIRMHD